MLLSYTDKFWRNTFFLIICFSCIGIFCPTILHAQSPTLSLSGNTSISAPQPEWKQVFFLRNTSDSTTIRNLTVNTFPIWTSGSDSTLVQLRLTPIGEPKRIGLGAVGPIDITPGDVVQLQLNAQIIPQGEYKNLLIIQYNDTLETHELTITRTDAVASNIEVKAKSKILGSSYGWGSFPIRYDFHVVNPGNQPISLEAPNVYNLGRSHADQDPVAASQNLFYLNETGDTLQFPLSVQPQSDQKISLSMHGLTHVGNYTGTLSVRPKGAESATEQEINIQVRHYGLIALIVIAFGVALSSFVRNYLTVTRTRLIGQRNIAQLLKKVNEIQQTFPMMNQVPENILRSIKQRLEDIMEKLQTQPVPNVDKVIEKQTLKLQLFPSWLAAKEEVASMKNSDITDKLDEIFKEVESFLNDDTSEGEALINSFNPLPKDSGDWIVRIRNATIKYLEEAIDSWEDDIENHQHVVSDDTLKEDLKARAQQKKQIRSYINEGDFQAALALFEEACTSHIHLMAGDLKFTMEQSHQTPWMIAPENHQKWLDMKEKWQDELRQIINSQDYDTSYALYMNVKENYTRSMTLALQSWTQTQLSLLQQSSRTTNTEAEPPSDSQTIIPQEQELASHAKTLEEILTKLDNKEYSQAFKQYQSVEQSLKELYDQTKTATRSLEKAVPVITNFVKPIFKKITESVQVEEMKKKAIEGDFRSIIDLSSLSRTIKLNDSLVTGIALLLASITGLLLLWQKDPTWGTWEDYLLAFLWGFGFDQAGSAASKPNRLGNIKEVFDA